MTPSPIDWTCWQGVIHATLMFIVKDGRILLIEKKRGLGAGKINGPGGKIDPGEELEAHYRNRSMLKRDVLPEDIAEAAYWLASDMSAKSTGNMINVDAGNAQAFVR